MLYLLAIGQTLSRLGVTTQFLLQFFFLFQHWDINKWNNKTWYFLFYMTIMYFGFIYISNTLTFRFKLLLPYCIQTFLLFTKHKTRKQCLARRLFCMVDFIRKLALKTLNFSSPSHVRLITHKTIGVKFYVGWMRGILVCDNSLSLSYILNLFSYSWLDPNLKILFSN